MPEIKQFYCLKCAALVELLYFTGMPEEARSSFDEYYEVRLCKGCFARPVKVEKFLN